MKKIIKFQHGKLTSENFFYDKYGQPFKENTYKFYPNGFLKENKSMVEKNFNTYITNTINKAIILFLVY